MKKSAKNKPTRQKRKPTIDDVMSSLAKDFEVQVMDDNTQDSTPYYIPFRNVALEAITGGVPGGKWTEILGDSQSGKSFLLYELISSVLDMGGRALLHDAENAYSVRYGRKVGIDGNKSFLLSKEKKLERIFALSRKYIEGIRLIDKTCPILIGLDSYSPTNFEGMDKELKKADGKELKGYMQAKKNAILSQLMGEFTSFLDANNATFVVLNQGRKKMGVLFGDDKTSNAENVIKFYCTLRIWGSFLSKERDKKNKKKVIGLNSSWETVKNRNIAPFKKTRVKVLFDAGLHRLAGFKDLLIEQEVIQKVPRKPKLVKWNGEEIEWAKLYKEHKDDLIRELRG